jgi:hypothetical protein
MWSFSWIKHFIQSRNVEKRMDVVMSYGFSAHSPYRFFASEIESLIRFIGSYWHLQWNTTTFYNLIHKLMPHSFAYWRPFTNSFHHKTVIFKNDLQCIAPLLQCYTHNTCIQSYSIGKKYFFWIYLLKVWSMTTISCSKHVNLWNAWSVRYRGALSYWIVAVHWRDWRQ